MLSLHFDVLPSLGSSFKGLLCKNFLCELKIFKFNTVNLDQILSRKYHYTFFNRLWKETPFKFGSNCHYDILWQIFIFIIFSGISLCSAIVNFSNPKVPKLIYFPPKFLIYMGLYYGIVLLCWQKITDSNSKSLNSPGCLHFSIRTNFSTRQTLGFFTMFIFKHKTFDKWVTWATSGHEHPFLKRKKFSFVRTTDYGRPMKRFFIKIPNFGAWVDNLGR